MRGVWPELVVPVPIGIKSSLQCPATERQDNPSPPVLHRAELPFNLGVQLPSSNLAEHMDRSERLHTVLKLTSELSALVGDQESRWGIGIPDSPPHNLVYALRRRRAPDRLQSQQLAGVLSKNSAEVCEVGFVIDLPTRRIEIAGNSDAPCGSWNERVFRSLIDDFDGFLLGKRYLIHDRNPLFTAAFS